MAFYLQTEYPRGTAGGCCFFCKSAQRDQEAVIATDMELELDMEGLVAVCEQCATELGRLVGMTEAQLSETNNKAIQALEDALAESEAEKAEFQETLNAVIATIQIVPSASVESE